MALRNVFVILTFLLSFLLALATTFPVTASAADKKSAKVKDSGDSDVSTRVVMDSLFEPLTEVLPLSFDSNQFEALKNRAKVKAALKRLSDNSTRLQAHAQSKDKTFEFIAKSLSRDARDIYRWYVRGSYGESRYLLHNLTENCIACHSRLPETVKFPSSEKFFKSVQISNLSDAERAQLQTAMRQFDDAMTTFEKMFDSPKNSPAQFVMTDSFTDYLKLTLRVSENVKRPIPVLEKLLLREDLPKFIRLEVAQWLKDLKLYVANPPSGKDDLAIARSLIENAQKRMQFRMDRAGLVEYILASKYLNRYIAAESKSNLAESYYLLGVTESMIGRSYWLSQTEFYLETAVRMDPKSPHAERAYAMLEEQTMIEFSGSAGTHIPEDAQQTLDELRALIQGSK